ncbi:MAG: hypothetical protein K0Q52_179 [Microbacterium sp.]|jgi:hypothetical protein|nr:hypothetical protein [Microbacterium sp.]
MTAAQRATYGDFITLPSTPDVLWKVCDTRELERAGSPSETRAELRPYRAPAAADPTNNTDADRAQAHGTPTPVPYDEPIRVGRAERVGVVIRLGVQQANDGEGWQLRPNATTGTYEANLTPAQSAALERDAGDVFALSFYLPPLSPEEIRRRVIRLIADDYSADRAAREAISRAPKLYHLRGSGADTAILDAFTGDDGARDLTAALDAATAHYRAALAKELRTFGRVDEGTAQ